ncbi:MAG TPA: non-homologous end-joining DNA ligase [Candidatus Dormibacteraeota bacterium]
MAASTTVEVAVGNRKLKLSNLDKVLYPETGFRKAQVIDYYTRIAPALLPHLKDRPITLKRYPNGVDQMFFYEKNCPKHRPDWFKTTQVWSGGNNRFMDFCTANDLPSLVFLANLATIELHTSMSQGGKAMDNPTTMVFDFDPGPPATIVECCQVALWVRELLRSHGLECFAKTSGSKGLQLYVPLNTSGVGYEDTKRLSRQVADIMTRDHPDNVVARMEKAVRPNKVFIDWSQNDRMKTTINVYSLRARAHPTVSTPVTWDEVESCLNSGDPADLVFEAEAVLDRVDKQGDLFASVTKLKQKLPKDLD